MLFLHYAYQYKSKFPKSLQDAKKTVQGNHVRYFPIDNFSKESLIYTLTFIVTDKFNKTTFEITFIAKQFPLVQLIDLTFP